MKRIQGTMVWMVFFCAVLMICAGPAAAVGERTITVGSGSGAVNATVSLPITVSDYTGVGGITFTLTYDPAVLAFQAIEQATNGKLPTDGSQTPYTQEQYAANLFYQANPDNTLGRVMIAAATAQGLTTSALFKARFLIKGGNGAYPVNIVRTIIQNPAAGYATATIVPALVGTTTPNQQGQYTSTDFPVLPALLVGGSVTAQATTYSIGGKVTYGAAEGAAAAGATVTLKKQGAGDAFFTDGQTTTGADGRYNFTQKPGGVYYKVFVASNNPNFYDAETAPFTMGSNQTGVNVVLPAPQRLTGTVHLNGTNPPGLQVKVMNGNVTVGLFAVNPDGTFQTPPLPPLSSGNYTLYAVYFGLTPALITSSDFNWETVTLTSISGTISGLAPEQKAIVTAASTTGKIMKTVETAAADGTNPVSYVVNHLVPANDYILSAVGVGLPVIYYDGQTDITAATAVNATASVAGKNFNFTSVTTGTIAGQVIESTTGVPGIDVYAFETTRFSLASVRTGNGANAGIYAFNLAAGTYEIFVIKANGKIFYYKEGGSTQNESQATPLTVTVPGSQTGKNINVTECDNALNGRVTLRRADGDPVPNALITAVGTSGRAIALTDASGDYSLTGLCGPADYTVTMDPLTGNYGVQQAIVHIPTTAPLDFVIDTGATMTGTVIDAADQSPVANAMLYLVDEQGVLVNGRMYFTDTAGDYTIADIPSDSLYTLYVNHPLYRVYSESVSITGDLDWDVSLTAGAHFTGLVKDGKGTTGSTADDTPLPGVVIIVTRADATPVYAVTGTDGRYEVYGLDTTAPYLLLAQKRGFERGVALNRTPANGDGTVVDFTLQPPALMFDLSGTVTSGGPGNPVAGATVIVSSTLKNFFASRTTDSNGNYSFTDLPQSTDYSFIVVPGGTLRTYVLTGLTFTADADRDVDIPAGTTISGNVTRTGTAAINVFLYRADNNKFVARTTADGSRNFSFTGLAAGNYKVLAVSSGNQPRWYNGQSTITDANLVAAGSTGINITLAP